MQWSHTLFTPTGGETYTAKQYMATELNTDGLTRNTGMSRNLNHLHTIMRIHRVDALFDQG